jgi:hypothetical protein
MPLKSSTRVPAGSSSNRARTAASCRSLRLWPIALAAVVASVTWLATAHADDVLDRGVQFHISPAPLATALIEFSTQSGVQVAVADADVAQRRSGGVSGTLPVGSALSELLRGTGLEYSRVGTETVAIRATSGGAVAGTFTGASGSGTGQVPPIAPLPADRNASAGALPAPPSVTIVTPSPPTEQELAGDDLYQFIVHHATVHYVNTGVLGNLAHWHGGRSETICPLTVGLTPAYNAFVSARVRALATYVGAPVNADGQCLDNVRILFTPEPEKMMAEVPKWAKTYFGPRYPQMRRLLMATSGHAVQGWYVTAHGSSRNLNTDAALLSIRSIDLMPLWPVVIPSAINRIPSRMAGIVSAFLIVDTTKVAGYPIGTIADYVAQLALSVVQSPDHCDRLPSILDVMAPSCGAREHPAAFTAGDLAFLKALYFHDTGLGPSLSRDEIQTNMRQQFTAR